jgi:hypothetical protein
MRICRIFIPWIRDFLDKVKSIKFLGFQFSMWKSKNGVNINDLDILFIRHRVPLGTNSFDCGFGFFPKILWILPTLSEKSLIHGMKTLQILIMFKMLKIFWWFSKILMVFLITIGILTFLQWNSLKTSIVNFTMLQVLPHSEIFPKSFPYFIDFWAKLRKETIQGLGSN